MSKREPIRKIVLGDGKTVRWRLVVDLDPSVDPETGEEKRNQFTGTYERYKDAKAELSRIRHERNTRTLISPSKRTLDEELDAYLKGLRGKEAKTLESYRDALKPARRFMGARPVQELEKKDFDDLVDWMETSGRSRTRSKTLGDGLGPRQIILTLGRLQAALDIAVREKRISYNAVRLVERPTAPKVKHALWSDEEEATFFAAAGKDRLVAVIELFARGLRPEELCGMRWAFLDIAGRTVHTEKVRTEADGKPVEKDPKSLAGDRTLPLDDALIAVLEDWHLEQSRERRAAAGAYENGGYVLCDEFGRPYTPRKLRSYMYRLMDRAGVRRVTPYEAMRHAAGSRMSRAGVAPQVIAAWMGHTNPSFTADNYMHARPQDLVAARDALQRTAMEEAQSDDRVGEGGGATPRSSEPRRGGGRRGKVAGTRRRAVEGGSEGDAAR